MTMLTVDVEKKLGAFTVEAAFDTAAGITALFGPSGAGKTSIANMIAGLVTPDRGRIVLDDTVLFESGRIDMPSYQRRIGYVFQEGRLFPHLTVRANLAYGRRMLRLSAEPQAERRILDMLDIGHLMERRPGRLSGGERQRVAFGRALMAQPRLLLLDEPLASLDAARKREILPYLIRLRDEAKMPMIYVSHAPAEVRAIARRVVRIDGGRVVAIGGHELLVDAEGELTSPA